MRKLRDRPIREKLAIIALATTASALLLAGAGIIIADSALFRTYLERDLTALARIAADNSTAALAFNDPEAATQTLGSLRARPHVEGACLYRIDRSIFAQYSRDRGFQCPSLEPTGGARASSGELTLSQRVVLNQRQIGTLVLLYDLGEARERIMLYGSTVLTMLLISSLVAFLLSARLRAVISTPIGHLVQATKSVSETGDYSVRAEKYSGDELGVLVDRFNEMLSGIQARENELKRALAEREAALRDVERERERFHFMAESMPQKIFTAGAGGELIYLNRLWKEFTGLSFDQIRTSGWTELVHPEDAEASKEMWRHAIQTGEPLTLSSRFRRADGNYRWHLTRARAMHNAKGEIALWIGSSTEIHEQKEKEVELRRANEYLQQFAYSASHDLQEPIRNVAIYSEIVARRYSSVLDGDGRQYLEFLREGGFRLARLVNDLLAYTRASLLELIETPVDAEVVLKNTLSSLAEAVRESDARVTNGNLPMVYMGEAHLQQVLQNLISNALKYRNAKAPEIHVSVESGSEFWRFSVEDNGIGIDPEYKEKIFGVFKRLHNDKYSGTGIGLAICQRVVERYGGRIWVESEPGKGCTFYFTVPQHPEPVRPEATEHPPG